MNLQGQDLLDAARASLHDLTAAGNKAVATPSTSPAFGQAQMDIARAEAFEDAMLASLRSRFAEIRTVSK